jgi:alpha-tubulin suppressor-like RCC1 family protein
MKRSLEFNKALNPQPSHAKSLTTNNDATRGNENRWYYSGLGDVFVGGVAQHHLSLEDTIRLSRTCRFFNIRLQDIIKNKKPLLLAAGSHHMLIYKERLLYGFGCNSSGELGLGNRNSQYTPQPIPLEGKEVQAIAVGTYHTVILYKGGLVYGFGCNSSGELGLGNRNSQYTPQSVNLGGEKAQAIAASGHHTVILCEGGLVYGFGYNKNLGLENEVPIRLEPISLQTKKPQAIATGAYHTLILCEDGSVFNLMHNMLLQPVHLEEKKAQAIAVGHCHAIILGEDGSVYSFGGNEYGQLGLGHTIAQTIPQRIDLKGKKAQAISAGGLHTIISCTDGSLYGFGNNSCGQLGLGHTINQTIPQRIDLKGKKAQAIAAGGFHTIISYTDGSLYGFGKNSCGELGLGHTINQTIPQLLKLSSLNNEQEKPAELVTSSYPR